MCTAPAPDQAPHSVPGAGTLITTVDLCDQAGITYRVCDRWARHGVLQAAVAAHGQGSRRLFPSSEASVARRLHELSRWGIGTDMLAAIAADLRRHGNAVVLEDGVRLEVALP